MKNFLLILVFLSACVSLRSQDISWFPNDPGSGHILSLKVGADFGTIYGLSYGYKFGGKIPFVLGADVTTPFGKTFMDDFTGTLTAQTMLWPVDHLGITVKPGLSCRRYASDAAVIVNIGAELGTSIGYYRDTWGFAAEATYDHARATLIKHRTLRDYYPDIKDEWYGSTGGTFKFGVAGHYWMKSTGIGVKAGRVYGQNFENNPTIPFYADVSVMRKW